MYFPVSNNKSAYRAIQAPQYLGKLHHIVRTCFVSSIQRRRQTPRARRSPLCAPPPDLHPMASKLSFPISAPPRLCLAHSRCRSTPVEKQNSETAVSFAFPHFAASSVEAVAGKTDDVQLLFLRKMGFPEPQLGAACVATFYKEHLFPLSRKPALGQFDPHLQQTRPVSVCSDFLQCISTTFPGNLKLFTQNNFGRSFVQSHHLAQARDGR